MEPDITDELFSELAQPIEDENDKKSKKFTEENSKKVLARAFGIEITIDSEISVSKELQRRIDKLLSDVALLLHQDSADESANKNGEFWYYSARGDEPEEDDERNITAPTFASSFNTALSTSVSLNDDSRKDEEGSGPSSWIACFNCDGAHNVAECPEPKDDQRIRKNLFAFRQKVSATPPGRYHADKDERFKKYVPGMISDNLRDALGLRTAELPPWIYEMRALGYPPGYFRQLLKPVTKLVMYNEQNGKVNDKQVDMELDVSNLVEYPGFNVPLSEGFRDDYRYRHCLPMLPEHSKETFLAAVASASGINISSNAVQPDDLKKEPREECANQDMEISDDDETKELERERQRILKELEADEPPAKRHRLNLEVVDIASESSSNSLEEAVVDLASPESPSRDDDGPLSPPKAIPLNEDAAETDKAPLLCSTPLVAPLTPSVSQSLSVDAGTPVHGSFLRGSKPELAKFAYGITPFSPNEEASPQSQRYKTLKKIVASKR